MEQQLSELVNDLRSAAGGNLKAVILYGSAAGSEFHAGHSDLNVLCLVEHLDARTLRALNPAILGWMRQGQPAPRFFTTQELTRAADVFAIELLDMKASHRLLFGQDFLSSLEVPMSLHHLQVERELRIHLLRLRQAYAAAAEDAKALLTLLTQSISTFTTLFRHALLVFERPEAASKGEAVDRMAQLLGFSAVPFHTILELRAGTKKPEQVDLHSTFSDYLDGVTQAADGVDKRIGEKH